MNNASFPPAWLERMAQQLGGQFNDFMEAHDAPTPRALRLNPQKPVELPNWPAVKWNELGRYIPPDFRPAYDPLFHGGAYYVQEPSSMFLAAVLNQLSTIQSLDMVLDLAAAPGGKSTLILDTLPDAFLVANEVVHTRVTALQENLTRWGRSNYAITSSDPVKFRRLADVFDLILVDAPCSGEGLFRKDVRARQEWTAANAQHCALRQTRILADVIPALKPGGFLVYSTCTYNPAENQDQLTRLLESNQFASIHLDLDPAWNIDEIHFQGGRAYQFLPHKTDGEGLFIAILQKTGSPEPLRSKPRRHDSTQALHIPLELTEWLSDVNLGYRQDRNGIISGYPPEQGVLLEQVETELNLRHFGIRLCELKGKTVIPCHDLALSGIVSSALPRQDLSLEEALDYLGHIRLPRTESVRGPWVLANYQGLPIGWIKQTGAGLKNYHPIPYRLRNRQS